MSGSICRKMTSSDSPDQTRRPSAIVAGHGAFPEGLVNAVNLISGNGDVFIAVSNTGMSGSDIEASLRHHAEQSGVKVFFTDLPGGSATLAVRRMMHSDPGLVLITGANLATLLEFSFQTDADPRESAKRAAEKGRAALTAFGGA